MDVDSLSDDVAPKSYPRVGKKHHHHARGNNHKAQKDDKMHERSGNLVLQDRQHQNDALLYPRSKPTVEITLERPLGLPDAATTKVTLLLPFSTTGIGLTVQALYYRYYPKLQAHISIFQLYQYSLAQFELTWYVAHQTAVSTHPYSDLNIHLESDFQVAMKGYPENFKLIVALCELYGHVKMGDQSIVKMGCSSNTGSREPQSLRMRIWSNIRCDGDDPDGNCRPTDRKRDIHLRLPCTCTQAPARHSRSSNRHKARKLSADGARNKHPSTSQ